MTDGELVELYWARSEQAIEATEREYGRYFHHIAYGILKNHEDAEEIVNDTYLKAWNTIPPERPDPLRAFLGMITRRLSINRLEQNSAQKRGGGQYNAVLDELSECVSDGECMVDRVVLCDLLERFLRSLSVTARTVFIKRYWHLRSVADIAGELSMSESRVKSLLMRTREKLKKQLIKEGFEV